MFKTIPFLIQNQDTRLFEIGENMIKIVRSIILESLLVTAAKYLLVQKPQEGNEMNLNGLMYSKHLINK